MVGRRPGRTSGLTGQAAAGAAVADAAASAAAANAAAANAAVDVAADAAVAVVSLGSNKAGGDALVGCESCKHPSTTLKGLKRKHAYIYIYSSI